MSINSSSGEEQGQLPTQPALTTPTFSSLSSRSNGRSKGTSSAGNSSSAAPIRLLRLYLYYLDKHPVATKAVTSSILAAAGDLASQLIVQLGKPGKKHYSWRSTVAFATFGLIVTGPVTHTLYWILEAVDHRRTKTSTIKKLVIDRLVFAPPYLLALLYFVARFEGRSHSEAWAAVKAVFLSVLIKNWVIWGIAQYINLSYVPVKHRVLFANLTALIWNIYLALSRR